MCIRDSSRYLLNTYGGLTKLAFASPGELANRIKGMGKVKAQVVAAALELGRRMVLENIAGEDKIRSPQDVVKLMFPYVLNLEKEIFWVLHLDTKNTLKREPEKISTGIIDAAIVHPREVFREAIRIAASSIILVHNHPSGDPSPSREDIQITKQLVEAGEIIDIKVLDHIIIGHKNKSNEKTNIFVSLKESKLIDFCKRDR